MLYGLGFFSGFAAILYQIVWMRDLSLIFGSSSVSIGICLAAFMAGLGLGSFIIGKLADRFSNPARLYGWLEFGIGAYGMLSPIIFSGGNQLFHVLYDLSHGSPTMLLWLRAACSFGILLLPTFLMGGTYPAAIRYLAPTASARGKPLGLFYGTNTLGASAAAFGVPFLFLEHMGIQGVIGMAVLCNAISAFGAFFLLPAVSGKFQETTQGRPGRSSALYAIGLCFFLSGFVALSLETLYNRILVMLFGSSIYCFAMILGVFLFGIGIGGWWFSRIEGRFDATSIFFFSQAAVFAHLGAGIPWMDRTAFFQLGLLSVSGGGFSGFHLANILVTAVLAGIPAVAFGIGYPAALKILTEGSVHLGGRTGFWSAINGVGTTLGSLLVTFLFLPAFGSQRSFQLCFALTGLSLIFILSTFESSKTVRAFKAGLVFCLMVAVLFLSAEWDLRPFHTQIGVRPSLALKKWKEGEFEGEAFEMFEVKSFMEGTDGTVSVVEFKDETSHLSDSGTLSLFVNGKVDASDNPLDMSTQSLLALLPMQFFPKARTALVVGLGSGVTAAALARYPLDRIDLVEISPDVTLAARRFFSHVNENVLEDPRVRTFVEDGRNFLELRNETYDLIVSEPSNAWVSGVSNLFTREYFALVKKRLAPGGIFCEWFYTYSMSWENLLTLLATLRSEFPHCRIFNYEPTGDLVILASIHPLEISPERIYSLDPLLVDPKWGLPIKSFNDFMRGYVMGSKEMDPALAGVPLHSDRSPVLELRGPKDLFVKSVKSNRLRLAGIAPEVTFEWNVEASRLSTILGVEPRFDAADFCVADSGIRVVNIMDTAQTEIRKQSFKYTSWISSDGRRVEIFNPLHGKISAPAHRLSLGAFSTEPPEKAEVVAGPSGILATVIETTDTSAVRIVAAWNCPESGETFFVRYLQPRNVRTPLGAQQTALNLFVCRPAVSY